MSTRAVMLAAVLTAVAGCGGSSGNNKVTDGGGGGDPLDGFILTGCTTASDCVSDACNVAKCNAATHMCENTPKSCTQANGCTISATTCVTPMCDPSSGSAVWTSVSMNEGMTCTTDGGAAGTCNAGTCAPVPSCMGQFSFLSSVCGPDNTSETVGSNDPNSFDGGAATVSTYSCAPNEAGPELAFPLTLDPTLTGPTSVTVSLRLVDSQTDATLADQTTVDLDLIVLEGQCSGTATCMNPISGSVTQGVTAGTSAERVTFTADPTKTYYLVVDGKDANQVGSYIVSVESCGRCAVTPSTELSCNTSMAVNSTTAGGSKVLTNYTCAAGTPSTFALAGNETPFLLTDSAGTARKITATVSSASMGTGLLVLNQSTDGDCQAGDCIAGATVATAGGSANVSWSTNPMDEQFTGQSVFQRFWVVVDTPGTVDTTFGLAVSCAPYCVADPNNALTCGGSFDTKQTSDATTVGGPRAASQWGPSATPCQGITGLTGPESVIPFTPSSNGTNTYTFQLQSDDPTGVNDLTLIILDAGSTGTCDPTAMCPSTAVTALSGTGRSGTFKTDIAHDKTANVQLSAIHGHTYLLVIDGTAVGGAPFDLAVTGSSGVAGCQ